MTTALSGASALAYWRTPPLVRALTNPSDEGAGLPITENRLLQLRRDVYQELEVWRNSSVLSSRGRPIGSQVGLDVLDTIARIAPSVELPIEVLIPSRAERRYSGLIKPQVMSPDLTADKLWRISKSLSVASPALTLLTLAPRLTLAKLVMLASELCGAFSLYRVPPSLASLLEELNRECLLPRVSSWAPSFDRDGSLTNLWSRPPLTTPAELAELARQAKGRRGARALARAAELVVAGAASPFEVQAGMLLGLPDSLGGEGYSGFSHNYELALNASARRLAGRGTCRCDLYWPASEGHRALDLECQSRLFHVGIESGLSDADRATALQSMGVEVLLVTYAQFSEVARFDALSAAVAEKIGRTPPAHTREFLGARKELRSQVLVRWEDLLAGSS